MKSIQILLRGQSKVAVRQPGSFLLNSNLHRHISTTRDANNTDSGYKQPVQGKEYHINGFGNLKKACERRDQLQSAAKRIVVKVGSAIITHDKGHLSAPRLAGIVEQIVQLQEQGRQVLLVSSGSVAFGRKKIRDEVQKLKSIRETISETRQVKPAAQSRTAAAVGQSSLMSFYEGLFQQYDCKVAQVLVTKADFRNEINRKQLRNTILDLLSFDIVPIVNTNDVVEATVTGNLTNGLLDLNQADMTDIIVEDNDSLAAILAAELESDLMILLSNVDGVYSGPPDKRESKLASTFTPKHLDSIEFGTKSSVGLGGMQAKVKSALWALRKGTNVVICNGSTTGVIERVVRGERVGTFFSNCDDGVDSSQLATMAREGSKKLKDLGPGVRSKIIQDIAQSLIDNEHFILGENKRDLIKAEADGLEESLLARLKLSGSKLQVLSDGLNQIAKKSNQVDRQLKHVKISDTLSLKQVTSPIGVLLVIFESRPDCLPQITSLSLASANGLLLKGGKEAHHSNLCLFNLIRDVLRKYDCQDAVQLVGTRDKVNELVGLGSEYIDLIIPRGSNQLVRTIQQQAHSVPVLGHSEGICHVYIDKDARPEDAIRIAIDSKCNYPAACNAMETLLIHRSIVDTDLFPELCSELKKNQVKVNIGPKLAKELPIYNQPSASYRVEYVNLECTLEVVNNLDEAINHINEYGSGHTDSIVTTNQSAADKFKNQVDSASVFVNCSTRFADGYRFGLGAEVGISTSKIHARGPAGIESLLTYKWILEGSGDVVGDYESGGGKKYVHEEL